MTPLITYPLPVASGVLHLMPCPQPESDNFSQLARLGVKTVVSLLQSKEAMALGLSEENHLCAAAGLAFMSFPVPDHGTPRNMTDFSQLAANCYQQLQSGQALAVHCFAGIGRTGLLGAAILMQEGMGVDRALLTLARTRGTRVPETRDQIQWLHRYYQEYHSQ